jgi:hypothetical protein
VGDEQCCLGDASSRCAASSETCDEGEIALGCDDPSDCSGTEVCCAELVFDFPQSARCVDRLSCPSEALDTEEIMLCTPAAADPCLGCGACQLAAAPLDDYSRCR